MQTWVRRGLQTALVTGGLLMLGTGIASASENVNPDTPANPVDVGVNVPVDIDQNQIGTPAGPVDTPAVHQNISTADLSGSLPTSAATGGLAPVTGQLGPAIGQAGATSQAAGLPTGDLFRGNKVVAHADAPLDICGNAVAAGGDAAATGTCTQSTTDPDPVTTSGANSALAGNVAGANWAVPVQVTGNAVGGAGNATSTSTADQTTYNGGDITTDGSNGVLAGTLAAGQLATPVQVGNNAVAGGGTAQSAGSATSNTTSDGALRTNGSNGTGAGTSGALPVALPAQLDGNAVGGIGNSSAASTTTANSRAGNSGASNLDWANRPAYLVTNGDPSTASGTVAQAPVSGPLSVDDNAASGIGNTTATSTNSSTDTAGGVASTLGNGSVGSGSVANAPLALPTQGSGNGAAAIGNATANDASTVGSTAGGNTFSLGNNSVLSSTTASTPPAGSVDVCGNSAGGAGQSSGTCLNTVTSSSGGYTGTSGNNAIGSGTIGQTPLVAPVEAYGSAGSAAGTATASATETKTVSSATTPGSTPGGSTGPNATDDNGVLSANVVQAAAAVPAQVFGDTPAAVGNAFTTTTNHSTATAGAGAKTSGHRATGSGNVVDMPASVPAQVFGDTDTLVGNGGTSTDGVTSSTAGGHDTTDGSAGSVSGNVVNAPVASAGQVFGEAGSVVGLTNSSATNVLSSKSGGNTTTNGDGGSLSGDIVDVPAMPIAQGFGDSVAGLANSNSNASNVSVLQGGGTATTSGAASSGSGDVLSVPLAAQAAPWGDAVSALGNSTATASNTLTALNGGATSSSGSGSLAGYNFLFPLAALLNVDNTPLAIAGRAATLVQDNQAVMNGNGAGREVSVPVSGQNLPVNLSNVPSGAELAPALNPAMWGGLTGSSLSAPGNAVSGVLPATSEFFPNV